MSNITIPSVGVTVVTVVAVVAVVAIVAVVGDLSVNNILYIQLLHNLFYL